MARLFKGFMITLGVFFAAQALAEKKIGIVFDRGGKDDKSFNASAFKGVMEAKEKLKVSVKYVEASDDNAFQPMLKSFATKDYDLIIGVGFSQAEAMQKVAKAFPKTHFAIVDAKVAGDNIRSLVFAEHEGSFLVGAIAALKSKSQTVGFIGGMDIPLIRRFATAYEAGARYINPKITVITNFVGVSADSWNNPPKGKELALAQYNSGADVIFGAAGASGNGIFDAAEEKKKYAIGVDSNQNGVKPGYVLTSMMKRVDLAVFKACEDVVNGTFSGGVVEYGIANQGVDYAIDEHNDKLMTAAIRSKVKTIKEEILAGKIKVPDFAVIAKK